MSSQKKAIEQIYIDAFLRFKILDDNLNKSQKDLKDLQAGLVQAKIIIDEIEESQILNQKKPGDMFAVELNKISAISKDISKEYQNILRKFIDSYYDDQKTEEAFELTKSVFEANPRDVENIYRMARSYRQMSSYVGIKNKKLSEEYILKAFDVIEAGKKSYPNNGQICLWFGSILDLKGRIEGINTRIKNSFIVKENFDKALKELPDDFLPNYCLGVWHFEVANIPYAKRLFAKTIFSSPPTSSYENSLPFLEKAYQLQKGKPYSGNLVYLAKCHYYLKNYDESKKFAKMVMELSSEDLDTIEAKNEAKFYC